MSRNDRRRQLDQFRLALAENCTMAEAAARLDARTQAATVDAAKAAHGEAMRRLIARMHRHD